MIQNMFKDKTPGVIPRENHLEISVILVNVPFGTNSKTNPSVGCGMRMKYHLSPELSVSVYFITSTTAPFFSFGNSFDELFLFDFV